MTNQISFEYVQKTIKDLINLYEGGHLKLNPGFQRESVWNKFDRRNLIDSILHNYPLPSIFLYRRHEEGEIVYDVIDGKQRIETILMFTGYIKRQSFSVSTQLPDESNKRNIDWRTLRKEEKQYLINSYKIQVVEVSGDLSDIIHLFVRINSTGKALTPAEKRHARFYNSEFLKIAGKIAEQKINYFISNRILSQNQIARMKHVELISELMVSIHTGDIINKKSAIDNVMEANSISHRDATKTKEQCIKALNRITKIFPDIKKTRFCQLSDFYTLVILIWKFEKEGLILTDRRRNKIASELICEFSNKVDRIKLKIKNPNELKADGNLWKRGEEMYVEYLTTVMHSTDEIGQRKKREEILRNLLESLFKKKDTERIFSDEQRRIIWSNINNHKCKYCSKPLTFENFTIDHIKPYSKGGKTIIKNAIISCRSCNSRKKDIECWPY